MFSAFISTKWSWSSITKFLPQSYFEWMVFVASPMIPRTDQVPQVQMPDAEKKNSMMMLLSSAVTNLECFFQKANAVMMWCTMYIYIAQQLLSLIIYASIWRGRILVSYPHVYCFNWLNDDESASDFWRLHLHFFHVRPEIFPHSPFLQGSAFISTRSWTAMLIQISWANSSWFQGGRTPACFIGETSARERCRQKYLRFNDSILGKHTALLTYISARPHFVSPIEKKKPDSRHTVSCVRQCKQIPHILVIPPVN